MPSKSKSQSRFMTANCKSADFRRKTGMDKNVACKFHNADKGKYHEEVTMKNDETISEKVKLQHALKTEDGDDTEFRAEDIGRMKKLAGITRRLDANKEDGVVDFDGVFTGVANGEISVSEGKYAFFNSLKESDRHCNNSDCHCENCDGNCKCDATNESSNEHNQDNLNKDTIGDKMKKMSVAQLQKLVDDMEDEQVSGSAALQYRAARAELKSRKDTNESVEINELAPDEDDSNFKGFGDKKKMKKDKMDEEIRRLRELSGITSEENDEQLDEFKSQFGGDDFNSNDPETRAEQERRKKTIADQKAGINKKKGLSRFFGKESEMFPKDSLSRAMIEMIVDEMNKGKEAEEISEELSFDVDHVAKVVEFVKTKQAPVNEEEVDEGKKRDVDGDGDIDSDDWKAAKDKAIKKSMKEESEEDETEETEVNEGLKRLKELSGLAEDSESYLANRDKAIKERIAAASNKEELDETGDEEHTVYCSSCGGEFKHDKKTGFSHCKDHEGMKNYDLDEDLSEIPMNSMEDHEQGYDTSDDEGGPESYLSQEACSEASNMFLDAISGKLGGMVGEQARSICRDGEPFEEQNANALRYIAEYAAQNGLEIFSGEIERYLSDEGRPPMMGEDSKISQIKKRAGLATVSIKKKGRLTENNIAHYKSIYQNPNMVPRGRGMRFNTYDATVYALKHVVNSMDMSRLLRQSTDPIEKIDLLKMMDLADRKTEWWKNKENFDVGRFATLMSAVKRGTPTSQQVNTSTMKTQYNR